VSGRKARQRRAHDPRLPEAVIIRFCPEDEPGIETYAAVRAAGAAEFLSDDAFKAEVLEPGALPLTEHYAPRELAAAPPNAVLMIGTSADGAWTTWHPPYPAEPVPGSVAWQAASDQAEAARGHGARIQADLVSRGGRLRVRESADFPPAIAEMLARFEAGIATGHMCRHKEPGRAQVTHMFGAQPHLRLCERCAQAPLAALGRDGRCDLCGDTTTDPTTVRSVRGWLVFHMVLCDRCYPEGADAPRTEGGAS